MSDNNDNRYIFATSSLNGTYFQSKDIKVFPCAYRGYKDLGSGLIFNPESRGFTEYNFSHIYNRTAKNNGSYLISWENSAEDDDGIGVLKCVVGGYYFEIYGVKAKDLADKKLAIRTRAITLNTYSNEDLTDVNKTYTLKSYLNESADWLDIQTTSGLYAFTGLAVLEASDTSANQGELQLVKSFKVFDSSTATYKILPETKRLDDILITGTGKDAIQMLDNSASGEAAIALGSGNNAIGNHSITLGTDNIAGAAHALTDSGNQMALAGNFSVAIGEDAKALSSNAIAIGYNVTAGNTSWEKNTQTDCYEAIEQGSYQIVLGKYNLDDVDKALILGWGTSENRKNIFTVAQDGSINSTGASATFAGNGSFSGGEFNVYSKATNTVNIGSDAASDAGELNIWGSSRNTKVFSVSKAGVVRAASNLNVGGDIETAGVVHAKNNIIADGNGNNSLTLGSVELGSAGSLYIYKDTNSMAYAINSDGSTYIGGNTNIVGNLNCRDHFELIDTSTGFGTADKYIGYYLLDLSTPNTYVLVTEENYDTIFETLNISSFPTEAYEKAASIINCTGDFGTESNASIGKDLTVIGSATIDNGLTVTSGDINLSDIITANANAINLTGNTTNVGNLTINSGKLDVAYGITGNRLVLATPANYTSVSDTKALKLQTQNATEFFSVDTSGNVAATGKISANSYQLNNSGNTLTFTIDNYEAADNNTGFWRNTNDLCLDKGLHVNGPISCTSRLLPGTASYAGGLFISNHEDQAKVHLSAEGAAWFAQQLAIGPTDAGVDESTSDIFFRVYRDRKTNPAYAVLKGNFTATGTLTLGGRANINGKLTVGSDETAADLKVYGNTAIAGTVSAISYAATSDIRLKQNIKDYNCENSVLDLPIKEYEYINDNEHVRHIGCIAQDLQQICPELVHEDANGYLNIEESKLVYLLLSEVKKLKEEVNKLKGE